MNVRSAAIVVGAGRCRRRRCWSCRWWWATTTTPPTGSTATSRAAPARSRPTTFAVDLESEDDAYDVEPYVAVGDGRRAGHPRLLRRPRRPRLRPRGDLHRPAVLAGDHRPRHRRRRRLRRHPPARCRPSSVRRAWPWCSCSRSASSDVARGRGHRAGHASSASWTSRRPGSGSSSPPTPSACRPKRRPGTTATSRAGTCESPAGRASRSSLESRRRPRRDAVPGRAPPRPATPSRSPTTGAPAHPASVWPRPTPTRTSRWSSRTPSRTSRSRAATSSNRTTDEFTEAGLALVQLLPTGDGGRAGVRRDGPGGDAA